MLRAPIIFCGLVFACAAFLGYSRIQSGRAHQRAERQLAAENARAVSLTSDLASAREQSTAAKARLATVEADLANTAAKLSASDARAAQRERDVLESKAALAVHEANARTFTADIDHLRQELADLRASQATPEEVSRFKATIVRLESDLATAREAVAAAAPPLSDPTSIAFINRAGHASVVGVGPQNAFVVLDFGAERGAQLGQKLDVNQGTLPIATVLISDVRPTLSVAQVLPDSLRGVLQKGDRAVLLPTP